MNQEGQIPGRTFGGKLVAIQLAYCWISPEDPPLVELRISKLNQRFWGESWHFLPDEVRRLASLVDQAVELVRRNELGLVGQFVHLDPPESKSSKAWLTVSVSPAPYLSTNLPRIRLLFDDDMTGERPEAASLWFTLAASVRLAQDLRSVLARALGDEAAREDARETVVPVDRQFPALIPGHSLRVTGLGLRPHKISVYWVLTPPLPEEESWKVLDGVKVDAADNLGNEYRSSGCGFSAGADEGEAVTRGLFALQPGLEHGAVALEVFLENESRSSSSEGRKRLQVNLSWQEEQR